MGATTYCNTALGTSASEAFDSLCEDNAWESGHDYYSGTMTHSNSYLGSCFYSFDVYKETEKAKKERKKIFDKANKELEDMSTGYIKYIDLGIVEYRIVTPVVTTTKANPEYKLLYSIYVYDNNGRERRVDEVKTIADARKSLLKYAATYGGAYVKKEYVKVKGNNVVMEARTKVKKVKTKPKTIPKNAKLEIIHKYYFFGWVKE